MEVISVANLGRAQKANRNALVRIALPTLVSAAITLGIGACGEQIATSASTQASTITGPAPKAVPDSKLGEQFIRGNGTSPTVVTTVAENLAAANPSLTKAQAQSHAQEVVQPFLDNDPRAVLQMWKDLDVKAAGGFFPSMQDFTVTWSLTIANDTGDSALRAAALDYFYRLPDPDPTVANVLNNPSAIRTLALNEANANPDHSGTPYRLPAPQR